jgi:hypothetical protein
VSRSCLRFEVRLRGMAYSRQSGQNRADKTFAESAVQLALE